MKIVITFFLLALSVYSAGNGQVPESNVIPVQRTTLKILKASLEPEQKITDSMELIYFAQVKLSNKYNDKLILEKIKGDAVNKQLLNEIKRLQAQNKFLRNQRDTIFVRDTVYKKRKFFIF